MVLLQYFEQRQGPLVLPRRWGIEHVTNRTRTSQTRTSQAKSQTKPCQVKAESKQLCPSQCDTKALSDNSAIIYRPGHCMEPPQKRCEHKWRTHTKVGKLTNNNISRAVMNEIDPSLQCYPSLLSQLLHSDLKCSSRSFVIRHSILTSPQAVREERFVELLR